MHSLFLYAPGTGNNLAVKVFIRGWRSYYYVTDMKHILQGWKECLRRRLRLLHLETVEEAEEKLPICESLAYRQERLTNGETSGWVTGVLPEAQF